MSIARQIADLIDSSGDVRLSNLGNVPASDWNTLLNKPSHSDTDKTDASNISSGTLSLTRMGSGTANSTSYLRGDGVWTTNCTNHANCTTDGNGFANCTVGGNGMTNCNNSGGNCRNHANCSNCNWNGSDERLKVNITYIGLKGELKIYSWNYRWDLINRYEGVIAQDLINTKYNKSLGKDKDGYYMVNYNLLPI